MTGSAQNLEYLEKLAYLHIRTVPELAEIKHMTECQPIMCL